MKVRLFDDKRLAKDFICEHITEKEKVAYLVIAIVIDSLFAMTIRQNSGDDSYRVATTIVFLLISVIGIMYCYRENARGDGKAFIERFLCLSVPVGLKLSLLAIGVFAAFVAFQMFFRIEAALDWFQSGSYQNTVVIFNCAVYAGIFLRIAFRLREISQRSG